MMKLPFNASYSPINVVSSLLFYMYTVCFVASLSCVNMTEVMKHIGYAMLICVISGL